MLETKGWAELQKALDTVPVKMEVNVLRGALRAGTKVQLAAARRGVPVAAPNAENARLYGSYAGALRDSLKISTRSRRGVVTAVLRVGNKMAYYAHMVEFGTLAHFIKPVARKSLFIAGLFKEVVAHPGAKKHPFLRPAMDSTTGAALAAVGAYIRRRLERADIDIPDSEQ